jgi:hypothetical protein
MRILISAFWTLIYCALFVTLITMTVLGARELYGTALSLPVTTAEAAEN